MKKEGEYKMKELRNAIGYIRVSTKEQAGEDKYGIDAQRREILDYADKNGYSIVDWKIDKESGVKEEREGIDEILYGEDVSNPPYEAVIVFKSDRFARDTKLYFYYLYVLEKKNIKLISIEENFQEGSEFANIYRALTLFVAEQERKNIALRTSKGRMVKAKYGGYSGGRSPYGYKVEHGRLIINEDEKPIVEFVFAEHKKGTPMLRIADMLNDQGFQTRLGGKFHNSTVKNIVKNEPLYRGMYKYGKEMNWVQGVHEPILRDE